MITISQPNLAAILDAAGAAIERRSTIPILSSVKLAALAGTMTATATDLDLICAASAPATGDGAFCVPESPLKAFIKTLDKAAEIGFKPEDKPNATHVTVLSGRSKLRLPCLPVDDFPDPAPGGGDCCFTMDAADMLRALQAALISISNEEARYYLNGVFIHNHNGQMAAVATNGHHLTRMLLPLPDGAQTMPQIIVPTKSAKTIAALLSRHDTAEFSVSESRIRVTAGGEMLGSKLIDGTFPDYHRIIPPPADAPVFMEKAGALAALARAMTAGGSGGTDIDLDGKNIIFAVSNRDSGTRSEASMPCASEITENELSVNGSYLAALLAPYAGTHVSMHLRDAGSPLLFTGADGADLDLLSILMPMRRNK